MGSLTEGVPDIERVLQRLISSFDHRRNAVGQLPLPACRADADRHDDANLSCTTSPNSRREMAG